MLRIAALSALLGGASAGAATKFAGAVGTSSVLVVRTNGGTAIVDEYSSSAVNQSAPVQSVTATGCSLATGANQAYGELNRRGRAVQRESGSAPRRP